MRRIAEAVASRRRISVDDIYNSPRQTDDLTEARRAIWYEAYHHLGLSLGVIGGAFGKHHTTVLYGIVRWADDNRLPRICSLKKLVDYRPAAN